MRCLVLSLTATLMAIPVGLEAQARVGGDAGGGIRAGGMGNLGARDGMRSIGSSRRSSPGFLRGRGSAERSTVDSRVRRVVPAPPVRSRGGETPAANEPGALSPGGVGISRATPVSRIIDVPRSGSIPPLSPSLPSLESSGAQVSARDRLRRRDSDFDGLHLRDRRGRFFPQLPVVYVPWGFGYASADYDERYLRQIDPESEAESEQRNVIEIEEPAEPRRPASPTVFEVRPQTGEKIEQEAQSQASPDAIEVYRGGTTVQRAGRRPLYLIALADGVIHTSRQHWLQGEQIHYVTAQGARRSVSLKELNLDLTARLNLERGLPFVLELRPTSSEGEESGAEAP